MSDSYIGQYLDNRYEILEKIGSGGMADVYKARDHRLNRFVAVKILKQDLAANASFRKQFHNESQAIATLSNPNIVAVYDVSRNQDQEYIVMELISGITLKQYIDQKGLLSWKETVHFASQIARALSHAHSRGIIHRDIKPQNIMILKDGSVKVADFGIAQLRNVENTLTSEAVGSVHYISPEQARGGHVDNRSDIYSLGVVMYEMLTGRLPFDGDTPVAIAIQHISAIPKMPREINPDIPEGLESITMHAMEASLTRRYDSVDRLLKDLEDFRRDPTRTFDFSKSLRKGEQEPLVPIEEKTRKKTRFVRTTWGKKQLTVDEYRQNRRQAGRTSVLIGIFCTIVLLCLLVIFMWNTLLRDMMDPQEERVTIPEFVGSDIESVLSDPYYKKYFRFVTSYEYSSTFSEGYIIGQSISKNRQMTVQSKGIEIELTVSRGPEDIFMPNLANMDYREAKHLLEEYKLGLDIQMSGVNNRNVTAGYVTEQFPAADELLERGQTVFVYYSMGPETIYVTVPQLIGLTESQAIAILDSYHISYKFEYYQTTQAGKGLIYYQSVSRGGSIREYGRITLYVSLGAEEES